MAPNDPPIAEIYIDESSQNNHRYLVLGAVLVELTDTPQMIAKIMAARQPSLPYGEMKWTKVSRTKLDTYKRVIKTFFVENVADTIHFHSLVVDTTRQDHTRFNSGSREIGFNKEVYQLCNKLSSVKNSSGR
jgi:hypothetical protein